MELIASKGTESKERSADIVLNEIIQIRRYSIGGYSIQAIAASSVTPSEQSHGMFGVRGLWGLIDWKRIVERTLCCPERKRKFHSIHAQAHSSTIWRYWYCSSTIL
jgi:hypothetical protein